MRAPASPICAVVSRVSLLFFRTSTAPALDGVYVGMEWTAVVAIVPLVRSLPVSVT